MNTETKSTLTESQLTDSGELFASARNLADKGLQQYFTPAPLAEFIARNLHGLGAYAVLDLTAGSGNLLAPFAAFKGAHLFGVEIDRRLKSRELGIEEGNLPRLFPYLSELELEFEKLVLNPPFGLKWQDTEGKERNSVELTLRYGTSLLRPRGEGVCIMDSRNLPDAERVLAEAECPIYAVYHVHNLFAPVSAVECCLVFFAGPHFYREPERIVREFDFGHFAQVEPDLEAELKQARRCFNFYTRGRDYADGAAAEEGFDKLRAEFSACCKAARSAASAEGQTYTLELRGKQLRARLSDFQALKITRSVGESWLQRVRGWSGRTLSYFALNSLQFDKIQEALAAGLITAEPGLVDKIAAAIANSDKFTAPFYALKPTQRLGWLPKLDRIQCTAADPERGFVAGEWYRISTDTIESLGTAYKVVKRQDKKGNLCEETRELQTSERYLRITISSSDRSQEAQVFNERPESISYLAEHFDIPDPADVATHRPGDYKRYAAELRKLEHPGFSFRAFQVDDLARLLCREGGVLAWEQGLGKMIGGLAWALVKGYKRVLITAPQDLIPQWTLEAREKFGLELIRLKTPDDGRRLMRKPKPGPNEPAEFYIVHYEALSRNGSASEELPELEWKYYTKPERVRDLETGKTKTIPRKSSSKDRCPRCRLSRTWNGLLCDPRKTTTLNNGSEVHGCGYVHYKRRVFNMAHYLKKSFSAVIVDEGTKIKGDTSAMGLAVRSLRPRGRLILTGTPIKNFLHDSFWLLWWATGASASEIFPYGYADRQKFTGDFNVLEWEKAQAANGFTKGAVKARPEICNVSMLWKTLGPCVLRRRKSETGENLVTKRLVPVRTPFSAEQQEAYFWWLHNFGSWYAARPDVTTRKAAVATALAGLLGQLWKLRFCASTPAAERLTEHAGRRADSNSTPKLLSCLQLIREGLEAKEPVVVFNTMKDSTHLIERELRRAGIECRCVDGDVKPADRARIMLEFKAGKFPVLLAGLEAVNLGHNLETVRRAIVFSLPFDLAGFDQAINRIHRLTSKQNVLVHVLLTRGSIDERMWDLVQRKGAAAGLALDGALGYDDVEEINWNEFAKQLREEFRREEAVPAAIVAAQIKDVWHGLNLLTDKSGRQIGAAAGLLDSVSFDLSAAL